MVNQLSGGQQSDPARTSSNSNLQAPQLLLRRMALTEGNLRVLNKAVADADRRAAAPNPKVRPSPQYPRDRPRALIIIRDRIHQSTVSRFNAGWAIEMTLCSGSGGPLRHRWILRLG